MKYQTDKNCIACGHRQLEGGNCLHHVKSRGSGGSDEVWNLMPLCQRCHNIVHANGLSTFAIKYFNVKRWLEKNGWEFCIIANKWVNEGNKK